MCYSSHRLYLCTCANTWNMPYNKDLSLHYTSTIAWEARDGWQNNVNNAVCEYWNLFVLLFVKIHLLLLNIFLQLCDLFIYICCWLYFIMRLYTYLLHYSYTVGRCHTTAGIWQLSDVELDNISRCCITID